LKRSSFLACFAEKGDRGRLREGESSTKKHDRLSLGETERGAIGGYAKPQIKEPARKTQKARKGGSHERRGGERETLRAKRGRRKGRKVQGDERAESAVGFDVGRGGSGRSD